MDWWNAERITALIAVLAAILAWGAAHCADRRAKDANKLAENANTTAEQALAEAMEANRIAQDANKISSDANTISQRALAVTEDNLEYSWVVEVDSKTQAVSIRNDSAHSATNIAAFIHVEKTLVANAEEDSCSAFTQFPLEAELLIQELIKRRARRSDGYRAGFFAGGPLIKDAKVRVVWDSETGAKRSTIFEQDLNY